MMKRATAIASLVAVLIIILSPPPVAPIECECEPFTAGCDDCGAGRCCSNWGFCGYSAGYCTPCLCARDGETIICEPCHCQGGCDENQQPPSAGSNNNSTYASPHNLDDENKTFSVATYDPSLDKVSSHLRNMSSSVASRRRAYDQYGSAAICGPPSPATNVSISTHIVAGQCLLVTNSANGKQAMVRIRKKTYCSEDNGLGLDYHVFRQLDASSNGHPPRGRLRISYRYAKCIDN